MFGNKPILICCPLPPDYRADSRVVAQLEDWATDINVTTYYPPSGDAQVGRDMAVELAQYMRPRPNHILFVDYDVLPRVGTLKKLLAHNKDIVSGVYPTIQRSEVSWCLSREDPFRLLPIEDLPEDPFKSTTLSMGMCLVKMEVFDKLEWPYWDKKFKPGSMTVGEDIYFCQKARKAGYDLWVDPKLKCHHFKNVDLLGIAMKLKGNTQ